MNEDAAIKASNISKFFGDFRALNDLTISVTRGEFSVLLEKTARAKPPL